jgi:hypothetical protein
LSAAVREACVEFEEQIRKTWNRNPGEGRLQAAGLTSGCCCKKAGQQEMWSSFADFQASVKVLILYSNRDFNEIISAAEKTIVLRTDHHGKCKSSKKL